MDKLTPNMVVLCKLGSMVVHLQEALSNKGSAFDVQTIIPLIQDKEVNDWLKEMDKMALLPKKR